MSQTVENPTETSATEAATVQSGPQVPDLRDLPPASRKARRADKAAQKAAAKAGAKSQVPGLPMVNLLSPWVFEQIAIRRLRRRFVSAAIAVVVIIAAAWGGQHLRIQSAEDDLAVEEAETARLSAETAELAPVRAFVSGVEGQKATVRETMATEIYFSQVLAGLAKSAPAGAEIASLQITLAPAPPPVAAGETPLPVVSPCPGPDPFNTKVVVGCVNISGSAATRSDVGDFVIALGEDPLFVEPFISTTTTADDSEVTFSGSVGLSEEVFSGRYADLDQLLGIGS